jgi:hypothetical protein
MLPGKPHTEKHQNEYWRGKQRIYSPDIST